MLAERNAVNVSPELLHLQWKRGSSPVSFGVVAVPRRTVAERLLLVQPLPTVFDFERMHRHDAEFGKAHTSRAFVAHLPLGKQELDVFSGYVGEDEQYLQFNSRFEGMRAALLYARRLDGALQSDLEIKFEVSRPGHIDNPAKFNAPFNGAGVLLLCVSHGLVHQLQRPPRGFDSLGSALRTLGYGAAGIDF